MNEIDQLLLVKRKQSETSQWSTTMEGKICVNCRTPIKDLYKTYSSNVIKISECVRIRWRISIKSCFNINFCFFIRRNATTLQINTSNVNQ